MSHKTPLSRETFRTIVHTCMAILESYGFRPQFTLQFGSHVSSIFENTCLVWFEIELAPEVPTSVRRETGLTQRQMNQITLACAFVFAKQGVNHVHYNESLNYIRLSIADTLEAMGYEKPEALCFTSKPGWCCYKLWEEIAQQNGLGDEKIADVRQWHAENQPEYYENS